MRLGKVCITHSYVVDLDDEDIIAGAKEALHDDIMSAVKYQELNTYIKTVEAPEAGISEIFKVESVDENDDYNDFDCDDEQNP